MRQADFFKHFWFSSVVYHANFPNAVLSRNTKDECLEDARTLLRFDRLKMIARIEICEFQENAIPVIREVIKHES